jgi:hypothetical protein
MNTDYFKTTAAGLMLLAVGVVVAALVAGGFYIRGRAYDNTLSVTGSAKMEVKADTAKWSFDLVRKVKFADQKLGYAGIAKDIETTKGFLAKAGISADSVTVSPTQMYVDYDKQSGVGVEPDYQLRARVTVNPNGTMLSFRRSSDEAVMFPFASVVSVPAPYPGICIAPVAKSAKLIRVFAPLFHKFRKYVVPVEDPAPAFNKSK